MRRLLIILILFSSTTYAQSDLADEMTALRQLVESQNRLLAEQSAQLRQLQERVTELEGNPAVSESGATDLGSVGNEPAPTQEFELAIQRDVPLDAEEIGYAHMQSFTTGRETEIVEEPLALSESVDLYGSMRLFVEMGDEDPTLNDGTSRLGIRVARRMPNGRTVFGRMEWKTNLVDNNSRYVVGDSDSGGIPLRGERSDDAFSTRLGYLGIRFDRIGELTFGKQWSAYYDVAGWTDVFNVYGGAALSVYNAGTDGGQVGSGRADNAIIWRNARGKFSYGLQTQLKTTDDIGDFKGLAGSFIYALNENWKIGTAFSASRAEGAFEAITGDKNSGVATVGLRYQRGPWNAAFNIAAWDNREAIFFVDDTLIYDGLGSELYVAYDFSDRLNFYGGFNYTDPDIDDPRVDPDFGTRQLLLGASWFSTEESFAYIEALLSGSKDVFGRRLDSVLAAGFRFDF